MTFVNGVQLMEVVSILVQYRILLVLIEKIIRDKKSFIFYRYLISDEISTKTLNSLLHV